MFGKNKQPRNKNDFYPTPNWAVEELLKREEFYGSIWEPCCGNGNISNVLINKNLPVYSSDIDGTYGDCVDFLKIVPNINYNNIITNPPFSSALEFLLKSKQIATIKIAMLLRIAFLESQKRYDFFQDKLFPLKKILIFSKRINFTEQKSPNFGVAWYIWDINYSGSPTIEWIK